MTYLQKLIKRQKGGEACGICSVCSGSALVIDAAILHAKAHGTQVLIEATANQVNQYGGYTGMTPQDYLCAVSARADALGLPKSRLILGGDHLGPVVWSRLPAEEAMEKAVELVEAFAAAGYQKIHLDASMPLGGDTLLSTSKIAARTVVLCRAAEEGFARYQSTHAGAHAPVYVIGSEVPTPGGSGEETALSVTKPAALLEMLRIFETEFASAGLFDAYSRVVAAVVQPGVEFGNESVHAYEPKQAKRLIAAARALPSTALECHSTDYQTEESLKALVRDGFAILKVGPALTFAAREALFALCYMERELDVPEPSKLIETLEAVMLEDPKNWAGHYRAEAADARLQRRFSYSDRSRYYMTNSEVEKATERLFANLGASPVPLPLISQFLPEQYARIRAGVLVPEPRLLVLDKIMDTLDVYRRACGL